MYETISNHIICVTPSNRAILWRHLTSWLASTEQIFETFTINNNTQMWLNSLFLAYLDHFSTIVHWVPLAFSTVWKCYNQEVYASAERPWMIKLPLLTPMVWQCGLCSRQNALRSYTISTSTLLAVTSGPRAPLVVFVAFSPVASDRTVLQNIYSADIVSWLATSVLDIIDGKLWIFQQSPTFKQFTFYDFSMLNNLKLFFKPFLLPVR